MVVSFKINHPVSIKRFIIPPEAIEEFDRLRTETFDGSKIHIHVAEQFIMLASERVAVRALKMPESRHPKDWGNLPIAKVVPASFSKKEFLEALETVADFPAWNKPGGDYCRLLWDDDDAITVQGKNGQVKLKPKNLGFGRSGELYTSSAKLLAIIQCLEERFFIALPEESEMCRLSDDSTEVAFFGFCEIHLKQVKKMQQATPDALAVEFSEFRELIEVCPLPPEDGEGASTVEATKLLNEISPIKGDPSIAIVKSLFEIANKDGFESLKKQFEEEMGGADEFHKFVYLVSSLAIKLSKEPNLIAEILSRDEISGQKIKDLRILWQLGLRQEYWRGYQDGVEAVRKAASSELEGYETLCDNLVAEIPADLAAIGQKLRVWLGRDIQEETGVVPVFQPAINW